MRPLAKCVSWSALLLALAVPAFAQTPTKPVPPLIYFQGQTTNTTNAPHNMQFSLWDMETGGALKWSQTLVGIPVKNNVFAVILGNLTDAVFTDAIFADNLWLEVKVDSKTYPRMPWLSVPFAFKANTVPDGAITADKIADGAITLSKLDKLLMAAGGDLAGSYPSPLLATKATSLAKVSGNMLNSVSSKIGLNTANPKYLFHVSGNGGVVGIEGKDNAFVNFLPYGSTKGIKGQIGFIGANKKDLSILNTAGGSLILDAPTVMVKGIIHSNGTDFQLTGRGGGVGNNGGVGRALADGGADGLFINYLNDFGKVLINGDTTLANRLNVNGQTSIANDLNVGGDSSVGRHLNVSENLKVGGDSSVGRHLNVGGNFSLGGDNVRHMAVGANGPGDGIGITGSGNNSPALQLYNYHDAISVFGLALVAGHFSDWALPNDTVLSTNGGKLLLQTGVGGGGGVIAINGKNVGIGTPNPQSKLHVVGRTYIDMGFGGSPAFTLSIGDTDTGINWAGDGALDVFANGSNTMQVRGNSVNVNGTLSANVLEVSGSDVAEPYHIASTQNQKPVPGMVVSIDANSVGKMRIASRAYDKTVGGIISGANGIRPGLILRQPGTVADGKYPVASSGRVWCYCDAGAGGAIKAGDLLTTSSTPGYAMKASNFTRAQGAILGKAMSPLKGGKGMVLVLVTLQ